MVLHPLEFSECFLDSPWFRQSVKEHEDELERTNTQIKLLIKDAKGMLQACRKQGDMMQAFGDRLQKFQFEIIGENLTDAEKGIAGSLKEFGSMLEEIEGEWTKTIDRSELQLIAPLEKFRKDHIHSYREAKKSFDKSSERYYKQMEQTLGLSHKKKEQQLMESDNELKQQRKNFHKVSLNYVYKLQEVQERKKFEFVEHLLMFMQVYFNFFHQSHETAVDCKDYMNEIQMRLVSTRSQYDGTRDKTQMLMRKMMDNPSMSTDEDAVSHSPQRVVGQRWARAGYLFLMEKNSLGSRFTAKWARYFCMYTKENKLFQMLPPCTQSSSSASNAVVRMGSSNSGGFAIANDPLIVLSCVRRVTDSIDKRFCFDIEVEDSTGRQSQLTLQAISVNDRKKWIAAMDGKEPSYTLTEYKKPEEFELNENSIRFVKEVIEEIERRGVNTEGIYRLVGVSSKVDKLLKIVMDPTRRSDLNYQDDIEWELNTLTSALKNFFRNLPEPIMTFNLHEDFIAAAKQENPDERLNRVNNLVSKLALESRLVLEMLIKHLKKVASNCEANKMTIQNLGVCFGPTLMRPQQETVQSIMEIKFNNIIVEILIENYVAIFDRTHSAEEKETVNRKFVDSRPSLRFKSRVKPTAARRTRLGRSGVGQLHAREASKFQRGQAFRGVPVKSPSHGSSQRRPEAGQDELEEDSLSSDSNPDEFGKMSPLDLNLDLEHFSQYTNSQSKSFAAYPTADESAETDNRPAVQRRTIKALPQKSQPRLQTSSKNIQSKHSGSPSNINQNHNNSVNSDVSKTTSSHQCPGAPKNFGIGQGMPPSVRTDGKIGVQQHRNSCKSQFPEGVRDMGQLKDGKSDQSPVFQSTRLSVLKANSPSLLETRPRSTVISSRDEFGRASHPENIPSPAALKVLLPKPTPPPDLDGGLDGRVYIALYECEAEHESELSFKKDSVFHDVRPSDEPGWLIGTLGRLTGLIPENYVREKLFID